jgi:hypothetical protein
MVAIVKLRAPIFFFAGRTPVIGAGPDSFAIPAAMNSSASAIVAWGTGVSSGTCFQWPKRQLFFDIAAIKEYDFLFVASERSPVSSPRPKQDPDTSAMKLAEFGHAISRR